VADSFVEGYQKRGPHRPKGSKNRKAIIMAGGKRRRRKMSATARAKNSAAQKARWAKQKAGEQGYRPPGVDSLPRGCAR
jgi:hypothetical protein